MLPGMRTTCGPWVGVGHISIRCWPNVISMFWVNSGSGNAVPAQPRTVTIANSLTSLLATTCQAELIPGCKSPDTSRPRTKSQPTSTGMQDARHTREPGEACAALAHSHSGLPGWVICAALRREALAGLAFCPGSQGEASTAPKTQSGD